MKTNVQQDVIHTIRHRKYLAILMISIFAVGLSVAFYLYIVVDRHFLVYYGDAVSHMVGARKLVDWSENPGWQQIGTVWLPLPHFLLNPFTLIDEMFTTGFAGLAVSLPSVAATSALIYKLIVNQWENAARARGMYNSLSVIAFAAALLYALNPSIIYLGITAMTEAPFMLFFVASAYYLQSWYHHYRATGRISRLHLILCALSISAATLSRYEAWFLPLFLIPLVAVVMARPPRIVALEEDQTSNAHSDPKSLLRPRVSAVLISLISLSGIAIWLAYNASLYGDPFEFANAQYYSAASQALDRPFRESLFLQPANAFFIYGSTAFYVYGPALLILAAVGYIVHKKTKDGDRRARDVVYAFLLVPPLFTVLSLIVGIGEMTFWFNSRFVILLSPLLIMLAAAFVLLRLQSGTFGKGRRRLIVAGAITALFAFQLIMPALSVVATVADAANGFFYKQSPAAVEAGEKLSQLYNEDGGGDSSEMIMIMTGSAQEHRVMVSSGIPLRNYDSIIESSTWKKSYYEPWIYDDWIVMSKEPDSDASKPVSYWKERESTLLQYYETAYENEYFVILQSRS